MVSPVFQKRVPQEIHPILPVLAAGIFRALSFAEMAALVSLLALLLATMGRPTTVALSPKDTTSSLMVVVLYPAPRKPAEPIVK